MTGLTKNWHTTINGLWQDNTSSPINLSLQLTQSLSEHLNGSKYEYNIEEKEKDYVDNYHNSCVRKIMKING